MDRYMLFPSGMGQHQNGSYVLFADAQATIAALQARVKELCKFRQADHEQLVEVQKYWRESQDEVHELQSQLTQRTAERDALKLVNDTHMKTVMKLSHVVEQRTAELEAANQRVMDERNLSNSWMKKHDELLAKVHKSGQFGAVVVQDVLKERDTIQAELERVRDQFADLRKMVAALPKVEGKIEVHTFKNTNQVVVTYNRGIIIGTLYGLDHAKPVAALYEHRQGMEG